MVRAAELAKGELTKSAVLDEAVRIAGQIGLSGLTIGTLATATGMSKSGLFAHFGAKETLQLAVLARARDEFIDSVVRPALRTPRGEPRVRELFERWLARCRDPGAPCLFASVAMEYDDRPGVVRDEVVRGHTDFAESVQQIFRTGIAEGHFLADTDDVQFQRELLGIMLAFFHSNGLLGDASADVRARRAFERLLGSARAAYGGTAAQTTGDTT
jgi:AcrR family transcriptional regulator